MFPLLLSAEKTSFQRKSLKSQKQSGRSAVTGSMSRGDTGVGRRGEDKPAVGAQMRQGPCSPSQSSRTTGGKPLGALGAGPSEGGVPEDTAGTAVGGREGPHPCKVCRGTRESHHHSVLRKEPDCSARPRCHGLRDPLLGASPGRSGGAHPPAPCPHAQPCQSPLPAGWGGGDPEVARRCLSGRGSISRALRTQRLKSSNPGTGAPTCALGEAPLHLA